MGSSRLLRKPSMQRHARHSAYGSKPILRACRPGRPGFGNRALKRVEADPGAGVADAAGDVDTYCAAQQRLGPRMRDNAGIACRLIEAVRAAEAYAIIQHAEPNRAKRVFCRRRVTGSPSAQISPAFE